MSLQKSIKEYAAESSHEALSKRLGYRSSAKVMSRIKSIVNSPYMGLDGAGFDLRYTTPELILKLAEIAAIPRLFCEKVIEDIEADLEAKRKRFKPYIFMETNFKRTSQPVFVLGALQSRRFLDVDKEILELSLDEQVEHIQKQIKAHYAQHPTIDMWGKIEQYVYYYDESLVLIFSTDGELLDAVEDYFYSKATLSIK